MWNESTESYAKYVHKLYIYINLNIYKDKILYESQN